MSQPAPAPLNPYLDDEEQTLIQQHTADDSANIAGALRLRTQRDLNTDLEYQRPEAASLPEIINELPERDDDTPLLDQIIEDEKPPIDWQLFRSAAPFALLGIGSATALLFVVIPTLVRMHNAAAFSYTDNLTWWPMLAALLGIGFFAWQEGDNGKATLFSADAIIISIWY